MLDCAGLYGIVLDCAGLYGIVLDCMGFCGIVWHCAGLLASVESDGGHSSQLVRDSGRGRSNVQLFCNMFTLSCQVSLQQERIFIRILLWPLFTHAALNIEIVLVEYGRVWKSLLPSQHLMLVMNKVRVENGSSKQQQQQQ